MRAPLCPWSFGNWKKRSAFVPKATVFLRRIEHNGDGNRTELRTGIRRFPDQKKQVSAISGGLFLFSVWWLRHLLDVAEETADDGAAAVSHDGAQRVGRGALGNGLGVSRLAAEHGVDDVGAD